MPSTIQVHRSRASEPSSPRFADRLDDLGPELRRAAFDAGKLTAADVAAWFASYPEEVPTVNGEFPGSPRPSNEGLRLASPIGPHAQDGDAVGRAQARETRRLRT